MITLEQIDRQVAATVLGEFTLDDFREFEEFVLADGRLEGNAGQIDLLFDLTEMAGFTVDVAVEEVKFSRNFGGSFHRIAVVTDSQWLAWSAWLEQLFINANLRVFATADEARGWLSSE
jgi:hypothetical protein